MNRALLFRLHRYVGLALAPLLLLQAATGMLLLWHRPAARLIDPAGMTSRHRGTAITAGEAVRRSEAALPQARVVRLDWPATRDDTFLARLEAPGRTAYASIDPAGGAVLRRGAISAFPVELALALHHRLLSGRIGMAVVLLEALALLTLAGTGLVHWWPRRAPRLRQLAVRWTVAPRLVLRQLHRTAGVAMSAILAFSASTGVLLVVPELAGGAAPPAVRGAIDAATIDRAVLAARTALPGAPIHDLRVTDSALIVNIDAPERSSRALHRVLVPLHGGALPTVRRAGDDPAWWPTILPLHSGGTFGNIGRLVLLAGALTLAMLAISGPVMWGQAAAKARSPRRQTA
ncbi:PepSY-associated TM helix domain-containing protein [Sphingomonas adhaesiva]|uniref:PepSY-associated TM helix domain-containing protein n=1 Tax=Sphingomonas adhaesiva TaxID=28212 RepID=UPI002FF998EC